MIPKNQLIMGIHAVKEVLLYAPERLIRIYTETATQKGRKSDLLNLSKNKGVPVSVVSFDALTHMAGSDSHQSFVAHVKERKFYDVKTFLETVRDQNRAIVLMLDQIFDPQNFGALLRSAECLGAAGVVWSKNRGSDLTPAAAKGSSGASELVPLVRVANLAEAVSQFQKEGFEALTALLNPHAESALNFRFAPKTLLIVGSEGEGIQPLIQKRADRSIFIPMMGKIQSLNVATATSILLYSFIGYEAK